MSHCRQNDDNDCCRRDYWFETEYEREERHRSHCIRPVFPTVLQANVIIPQTVIPVRIVISPVTGMPTVLTQQAVGIGTNIVPGSGVIQRFLKISTEKLKSFSYIVYTDSNTFI